MLYLSDQRRRTIVALGAVSAGATFATHAAPADLGPLNEPSGLAVDADGRVLVADCGNGRVVVFDPGDLSWSAIAPSAADVGPLLRPTSVAVGADGAVLIADQGNHRIVRASSIDGLDWSAYGSPGSTAPGGFIAPTGVIFDWEDRILIADPGANRLIRIDDMTGAGWTELAAPPGARPFRPSALARASQRGRTLVCDLLNSRVLDVDAVDDVMTVLVDGTTGRAIVAPVGVCAVNDAVVVVADAAAARLTEWTLDEGAGAWRQSGALVGLPPRPGGPEFSRLCGLTIGGPS